MAIPPFHRSIPTSRAAVSLSRPRAVAGRTAAAGSQYIRSAGDVEREPFVIVDQHPVRQRGFIRGALHHHRKILFAIGAPLTFLTFVQPGDAGRLAGLIFTTSPAGVWAGISVVGLTAYAVIGGIVAFFRRR